jgi:membrane-bound ClpP family serine protease
VVAEGEMLSKGEHVKVVTADGIRIVVRRLVAGKPSSA